MSLSDPNTVPIGTIEELNNEKFIVVGNRSWYNLTKSPMNTQQKKEFIATVQRLGRKK